MQEFLVTPESFFRAELKQASAYLRIQLPDPVEIYLVNLLCFFIQPPQQDSGNDSSDGENLYSLTLAELFKLALESLDSQKRIFLLKTLGDISLYTSGFFQDSFNRKIYDVTYYVDMGSTAYASVADLMVQSRGNSQPFSQLARDFSMLVEVVARVYDRTQSMQGFRDKNILALYERWLKTNSDRLKEILRDNGIDPLVTNQKLAV